MGRYGGFAAAAALTIILAGCAYVPPWLPQAPWLPPRPVLLVCRGDFGQFANGFMVTRPMELKFVVDWQAPSVAPVDGGGPGRILALTPLELSFVVQYEGYKAAYHLDRIGGTFSQRPNLGGVFFGRCDQRPLETKL